MNLTSLTLAAALRMVAMVGLVMGALLMYDSAREQAVFERTAGALMQAMDERTSCLHAPQQPTIETLIQEGWLDASIVEQSPWTLGIRYQSSSQNGRVIAKTAQFTANDAKRLAALAKSAEGSWSLQGQTLTLLEVIDGPTDVARMEYDPVTACFAW
ncbi:hypothetical protein BTO01_29005 [Vibrio jasicida]|uniref:hypothetical protein n=1 Tax=Vibrio jasicida TaxID=766224 RepID=UPI000CF37B52|nr:hypothetical protein [Vibrio jasicida]PQJ46492.1 hypothetical protein BTO01_29005 [Vibrio jasicida]